MNTTNDMTTRIDQLIQRIETMSPDQLADAVVNAGQPARINAVLERLHIPTTSYIAAAQAAGSLRTECDLTRYNQLITDMVGFEAEFNDHAIAQMTFCYLVQEYVRSIKTEPKSVTDLYDTAQEKARAFVSREPWHWAAENSTGKVTRIEEIRRFVSMFTGVEKSLLIDRIAEEFEITRNTASTYLRQLEAESTDTTPDSTPKEKAPKINKGVEAAKLVEAHFNGSNKVEMIEMIVQKLNTSKGGAQTFFYAALKNLNLSIKKETKVKSSQTTTQDRLKEIFTDNPNVDKNGFLDAAEEMGIKRSTAQTYYYSLTSNMGVTRKGTGTRGRKREGEKSRAEQVRDFVEANPTLGKAELIDALSTMFTVSKLSAQSYYYAARKAAK